MKKHLLAITSGDIDGIGLEVCLKALRRLGPQKKFVFILFCSSSQKIPKLDRFRTHTIKSMRSLNSLNLFLLDLIVVSSNKSPTRWVLDAVRECHKKNFSGIVTGPLSKTRDLAPSRNRPLIGHTDIIKYVSKEKYIFMGFWGTRLGVVLATGHTPVRKLSLSSTLLHKSIEAANCLRQLLPSNRAKLPIGILGLNPHAGENGTIGTEEEQVYKPLLHRLGSAFPIAGPLAADAVFSHNSWKKYSVLVCSYHDQGLIPFKLLHSSRSPGVHLTLGIPFVRTSVDHGTAKDIFGKNKADCRSMLEAIKLAMTLIKRGTTWH